MDQRKKTGNQGESIAVEYLIQQGFSIIERNWRCAIGEVDIVAQQAEVLVFVEVRTRHGQKYGRATESITPTKQQRLIALAETYLQQHEDYADSAWRIDVVAIQLGRHAPQIEHVENAVGW
ncbi:YraN family protein [Anaerolineales bacterium HSG25]|nr:YraN family protein [Anaerolineales bacterium HSG25]